MIQSITGAMASFLNILFNLASSVGLPYYGVAIILFTIIIKSVLFPLTWKQMKSMRKMAEFQPQMQALQKKYGNNKQKLNEETMLLYSKENINPYAGCLPLLVQLPILWIFYGMLRSFPYDANDPSATFLGYNLMVAYPFQVCLTTGDFYHLIMPVLSGVTVFLSTKLSMAMNKPTVAPAANGKSSVANSMESTQKMMLYFMPVFLAYITASVPSGLGIYIVTMNIVSTVQTYFINIKLRNDKVRDDEIKEREQEREAARQAAAREERNAERTGSKNKNGSRRKIKTTSGTQKKKAENAESPEETEATEDTEP